MNKLRLFPLAVIVIGFVFAATGVVATAGGFWINGFVIDQLEAQNITTPGDASIPNAPVNSIETALSMADIIQVHALNYTDGLTYAEMGRFATEDGSAAGTSNPDEALIGENGRPVTNSARNTQLTASGLVTSLSLSAMAIGASYGAIALGIAFTLLGLVVAGIGYALRGLVTPKVAEQFGLQPVMTPATQ